MAVFDSRSYDHHELVAFKADAASGLKAIIAIHNTQLGPAVGGCRMFPYTDEQTALEDVLRLSRGMTYKSALAGLPFGGGKSVIIGNPLHHKTPELLRAMGDFIDSLGGLYIGAEDSGTGVSDIKTIGERTRHISGISGANDFDGDPSPYTAYGVYCGIKAAVEHRLKRDSLQGIIVAVQGAGAVGRFLIKRLLDEGAKVYCADINESNLQKSQALGAEIVSTDKIVSLKCDVFAPCAMGAIINDETVGQINASIVAGAANNQLATPAHGVQLQQKGILYAPDFVINAGGIIDIYYQERERSARECEAHVVRISSALTEIFVRAERDNTSTNQVAEQLAEEILKGKKRPICQPVQQ